MLIWYYNVYMYDFNCLLFTVLSSYYSEIWVWVHFVDTANTCTWSGSLDSDVTLFSPWGTPGVLNNPIVNTSFSSITNESNSVIKASAACCGIEDTWSVVHKVRATGNCNWDWLFSNCLKQSIWIVGWDVCEAANIGDAVCCIISAGTNSTSVWIWSFSLDFVVL